MEARPVSVETVGSSDEVVSRPSSSPRKRAAEIRMTFETMVTTQSVDTKEGETRHSFMFKPTSLQTSFRMRDGETIVIGSSRLQTPEKTTGDAIIAVVSARVLKPTGAAAKVR
jgi:hypothetical protein